MSRRQPRADTPSPVAEAISINALVTPEARAKGIYDYDRVEIGSPRVYIDEDGKKKRSNIPMQTVVRNKGGTTVDRWFVSGALDERQMLAIRRYVWAHQVVVGGLPAKSAWPEMSGVIARGGGMGHEERLAMEADARYQWDIMQERVFRSLHGWYDVWQNVVLHDEPAGLAGGRLGFRGRDSAATAALTTVRFFADLISTELRIA